MKKILAILSIASAIAVIMMGCKGGAASNLGPKETLVAFFEHLAKKDLDGAAKFATKDSKSTIDMMKKAFDMAEKMKKENPDAEEKDPAEEFKNMEIGDAKINGDNATVPVKNKKEEKEIELPLKKEDGAWKVDFSMATLMKMGQEENKRNQVEGNNPSDMKIDDMDTATLRKSREMADSLMKSMDPEKLKEMQKELEKLKPQQ